MGEQENFSCHKEGVRKKTSDVTDRGKNGMGWDGS